jgi:hypothetical protein
VGAGRRSRPAGAAAPRVRRDVAATTREADRLDRPERLGGRAGEFPSFAFRASPTAGGGLAPVPDVGEPFLRPPPRRTLELAREYPAADRTSIVLTPVPGDHSFTWRVLSQYGHATDAPVPGSRYSIKVVKHLVHGVAANVPRLCSDRRGNDKLDLLAGPARVTTWVRPSAMAAELPLPLDKRSAASAVSAMNRVICAGSTRVAPGRNSLSGWPIVSAVRESTRAFPGRGRPG